MKGHHHAWIALAVCSAFALEPAYGGPPPERGESAGGREAGEGERRERRGSRMARMWKMADTDGDGFISAAEFAAMERPGKLPEEKRKAIFKRFDKNGDNRIGPDEMPRRGHRGMPPLEDVDSNKDGKIVFEEFQKLGFVARLPEDRQLELFRRMDRDGDGSLTPQDRPSGKRRGGKGGRGPRELVKSLDQNGDGAVDFEEFRKAPFVAGKGEDEQEDRFEEMDRNNDLKIDAADFPPPEQGKERRGPKP